MRQPTLLRSRQHGGMLSMLLVLVVIGLAAYFALRSHSATQTAPGGEQQLISCTKLTGDLISRTGGIGADYQKGYQALPANCRSMLPPPAPARGLPDGQ
jgi:hypothetical protein